MRFVSAVLVGCIVALGLAANAAEARVRVGVVVGVPGPWYPHSYYYPGPYPYYAGYPGYYSPGYYPVAPAVIAVPSGPTTYIQQNSEANSGGNDWFYCAGAKAYYPYVKQCPGGWTRVAPKPAGAP